MGLLVPVSNSSWVAPVVIVAKINGKLRLCVNCKVTINKYIEINNYPLPRMDDIFASVAGCSVFRKLDMTEISVDFKN